MLISGLAMGNTAESESNTGKLKIWQNAHILRTPSVLIFDALTFDTHL